MCEPKSRTPGCARSSLLARVTMRRSSGIDVPGAVIQCMRKSRSLNPGNSSSPRRGRTATPMSSTVATVRNAVAGRRITSGEDPAVAALEPAHEQRLAAAQAARATAGSGSARA